MTLPVPVQWSPKRPNVLVVACSDGRLQTATDLFLHDALGIGDYDRFYVPGGGGALVATGRDFVRAHDMRRECHYLIDLHGVGRVIILFHGPAKNGSIEAACADYRRKLPWDSVESLRSRQEQDAAELLRDRKDWAGDAYVSVYRCEVDARGGVGFVNLGE